MEAPSAVPIDLSILGVDPAGLSGAARAALLVEMERLNRAVAARLAQVVAAEEEAGTFRADGFRSIHRWVQAVLNSTSHTARCAVHRGRLTREFTTIGDAFAAGDVGADQVDVLAQLAHRHAAQLRDSEQLLLGQAQQTRYDKFATTADRWSALADPDRHERREERRRQLRGVSVERTRWGTRIVANLDGIDGELAERVLEAYTKRELEHDWDEARRRHDSGNEGAVAVPRTLRQARADAFVEICRAAAANLGGGRDEPLVNLLIDADTFDHTAARMCGGKVEPLDPRSVLSRRMETIGGRIIDPRNAVHAALAGRVRQVVIDSSGRVLHLGRRRRFANQAIREAIGLSDRTCFHACCPVKSADAQADHLDPWTRHGHTDSERMGPGCGHHNRWKHRAQATTMRDQHGTWHTHRPDRSEIAPLGP